MVALVDTGATTSCCRWGWYKKWKSHLGPLRHSTTMVVCVGNVPIEVKGLSKPLMLNWDSVEGQCQLMVLTTLKDVDVILGMDVLSQFNVKINSRNQVASPERELCTSLILDVNSRLPLENPTFTLEGKIQVKEEEAEEIIKGVHRQGHLGEHKTWKAFNRKFITTEGREKCREIVCTCPECQLGKDYRQRHLLKGTIKSSRPWDVVSIDIMGPFPYDDKAKRFIVTMMDVYSRYIMAIPVGNHTTQTVSKCLYEHVVAYFGVPRSILSDRGAEFTSCVWESLTQILGSKIKMASPYYP